MTLAGIVAVLLLSVLLTLAFVFGLKTKGPWGNGWTFFIVITLSLCTVSLWVPPAGPVWFGAAWIDLLITGLLVSFILSAVTPSTNQYSVMNNDFTQGNHSDNAFSSLNKTDKSEATAFRRAVQKDKAIVTAGSFFWMLLLLLCVLIIIGAT
ncbi:MAG TPA: hypothetical protein VK666_10530 [Chryseolinea sp.]|nr:hypothetical protein [Chryseolinea sp.]